MVRRAHLRADCLEEPSVSQGGVETAAQNRDLRSSWTTSSVSSPCLVRGVCLTPSEMAWRTRW